MPQDKKLAHARAQTAEHDATPLGRDTSAHAGQLALAIGEVASSATSKEHLARELAALLARELGCSTVSWYWCEPTSGAKPGHQPSLKRAIITGDGTPVSRAQGRLLHASAEAAAASRSLVLHAGRADELNQQPEHIIACPVGAPEPVAVLVLSSPASAPEIRSHRVAVLSRLLPTLTLAVHPYTQARKEVAQGAASGLFTADYLSILSHDLRTPLHTLGGFLEMVHDGMAGPLNERQLEFLGYARAGAQQLGTMLEDVLLLSRADSSTLSLRRTRLEVASLLYGVLNTAQTEAQVRQVTVAADLPQDLPALLGDEDRLKHALIRLVSHAVSRSPAGSAVAISATKVDGGVTITVKDVGPAILDQQGRDLFSYVARKGVSRPAEGVSLGLAAARLLVELHGGHVELQCSTKDGTIVAATIPSDA